MLPPSGKQGAGLVRAPRVLRWLASTTSPLLVLVSPSPLRGPALESKRGREGPGKTTQIALQWARPPGGAGSPEQSICRAFSSCSSQVFCPASAGRCSLAGAREPVRGPGRAHPIACSAAGRSDTGRRLWLRKWLELLPCSSFQTFGVRINHCIAHLEELRTLTARLPGIP